ncbi:MAG: type II toxin-antitoxin system Phd/YefM family antitoxin [Treponema sp.]|jgi:prevent-host-death family protein|nr:type II toxin-antitoxin system Phd/YefM family antitoxin [Treponema sp.]
MNAKVERNVHWQLQEAKAMLSALVRAAVEEPQIITVRGEETAVLLSMEEYRKLSPKKQSIVEFFQNSPWADVELELPERLPEEMREIDL